MIIIGILAAIAIPLYLSQKQKAADTQAKSDVHSAAIAEESYFAEFRRTFRPRPCRLRRLYWPRKASRCRARP